MTDEQVTIMAKFIGMDYWKVKMKNEPDNEEFVKSILEKYEI